MQTFLLLGILLPVYHSVLLTPCPNSPNCVSSALDENPAKQIDPFHYSGDEDPLSIILRIVEQMPRSHLEKREEHYLHVTFHSRFFSFIDDVEFSYNPDQKSISVRSAARTGYYDFGVNRRRLKKIRKKFQKHQDSQIIPS